MKILFFSYAYPNPINPGLGTFNRTMVAGLSNEHEVRVVSPVPFADVWKAWGRGQGAQELNDPQFQAVPNVSADYCTWYYTPKLFRNLYGRFMLHSVGHTLNRVMREFQPDVVLSYWTHPDGEVAVTTARQFGIRAVTMVGGSDVLINGRGGSRRNTILNVLRKADGVVTVSDNIKQVLITDGISDQKMYVSRRGIDRRIFHDGDNSLARRKLGLSNDRPILISVGRLVDVKGHTFLLQACRRLKDRQLPFRCYLLGDGPLRSKLQEQIDLLGLGDQVELRGAQSPAQLAEWYRAADLSILASLSEGVPNVLMESIACGTPFVASSVGGIPEIADPVADRLVPAANPIALADAIFERLATVDADTRNLRRFHPPTMSESAEILSSILRSVLKGRKASLMGEAIMHETMTDLDLTKVQSAEDTTESPNGAKMTNKSLSTDFSDSDDDDILGRTGECFQLKSSVTSSTTSTAEPAPNADGSEQANVQELEQTERGFATAGVATTPYEVGSEDDDCGRTAEGFYYQA